VALGDGPRASGAPGTGPISDAEQAYRHGLDALNGIGVTKDAAEALKWFRYAASLGHGDAICDIGNIYLNGKGVDKDPAQALKWYQHGSELHNPRSIYNIGFIYHNGLGVARDDKEAVRWWTISAGLGFPKAIEMMGFSCEFGVGVSVNKIEAGHWYAKAATLGNPAAMYSIGVWYRNGFGDVKKDDIQAAAWFKKAANADIPDAMEVLGYDCQLGNPPNFDEAVRWYQKGEALGHAPCIRRLALMYLHGLGIKKDAVEAVRLCSKAADMGDPDAMYMLAAFYSGRFGVPQDDDQMMRWLFRAVDSNQSDAKELYEEIRQKAFPTAEKELEFRRGFAIRQLSRNSGGPEKEPRRAEAPPSTQTAVANAVKKTESGPEAPPSNQNSAAPSTATNIARRGAEALRGREAKALRDQNEERRKARVAELQSTLKDARLSVRAMPLNSQERTDLADAIRAMTQEVATLPKLSGIQLDRWAIADQKRIDEEKRQAEESAAIAQSLSAARRDARRQAQATSPLDAGNAMCQRLIQSGQISAATFAEYSWNLGMSRSADLPPGMHQSPPAINQINVVYDFTFTTQGGDQRTHRGYIVVVWTHSDFVFAHPSDGGWRARVVNIDGTDLNVP
jgi:TPR repeat protein